MAAKLLAVKVEIWNKFCCSAGVEQIVACPALTDYNFAVVWPTESQNTPTGWDQKNDPPKF